MLFCTKQIHNQRCRQTTKICSNLYLYRTESMTMYTRVLVAVLMLCSITDLRCSASRILAIIPTPFYAHQTGFRQLWKQLSLRGHQVTVVTCHPMRNPLLTNLTEVDMSFINDLEVYKKFITILGDGTREMYQKGREVQNSVEKIEEAFYLSPQIQDLLVNNQSQFDLVISEALHPSTVAFSWRFQCPLIGFSSLGVNCFVHEALGNPCHPILMPDYNTIVKDYDNLTLKERIEQVVLALVSEVYVKWVYYPRVDANMKLYFRQEVPPVESIMRNMSLMFLNTNPLIHGVRPLNPNTIMIGSGIHIEPPKELPQDIKAFIDDAKKGVIYFSLGSNIQSNLLKENITRIFVEAFRSMPYRILWRYDIENMNTSENVKISKWFPQQDVLRHPKVKLFITQGGLQSLEETLCFGVPILGIPFFGDQFHNVKKAVKLGMGLEMRLAEVNLTALQKTIEELIRNPGYRRRTKELGMVLRDRPMTGIEEAVWWTEYVLRHKGTKYLKNSHANLPLYQYYMLDITAIFLTMCFVILGIFYASVKICLRLCRVLYTNKEKYE